MSAILLLASGVIVMRAVWDRYDAIEAEHLARSGDVAGAKSRLDAVDFTAFRPMAELVIWSRVASEVGDARRAREILDEALAYDAKNADALSRRGQLSLELGELNSARRDLERAVRLGKDDSDTHWSLGVALLETGCAREGLSALEIALAKDPGNTLIRRNVVTALTRAGEYLRAMERVDELVALCPQDPLVWNEKAAVHLGLGDPEYAQVCLEQALEIDPMCVLAVVNLAHVHGRQGRLVEARELVLRAEAIDPDATSVSEARRLWLNSGEPSDLDK